MPVSDDIFYKAFNLAPAAIIIHAEDGDILYMNETWKKNSGYDYNEINTIEKWTLNAYGQGETKQKIKAGIDRLFDLNDILHEGLFEIKTKDNEIRVWDFSSSPLGHDSNNRRLVLSMAKDVSEKFQLEKELNRLATYDILTELNNRHTILNRLKNEMSRSIRYERSLSIFMIDLDHFKSINDSLGHVAGDVVLKSFSKILADSIRLTDYVGRFGGEEFLVILPETPYEKAKELAQRLLLNISSSDIVINDNKNIQVTVSIGVVTFPEHGQSEEALIDAADKKMYKAKHAGRNQVE